MNLLRFPVFIVVCLFSLNIFAKDIFVSVEGNDSYPGTQNQPLASLYGARDLIRDLRAANNLEEEIRVIISGGTYYMAEPLVLSETDSGSEKSPVTFIAAQGGSPVFIGGIQIKNWEKVSDRLWKTKVPEVCKYGLYFEQLYVNGKRATRAKSPNEGFYFLNGVNENVIEQGNDHLPALAVQKLKLFSKAAMEFSTFTKNDFNDALVTFYHKWDNTRKHIYLFNSDSSFIYTVGRGMKSWNKLDDKTRFLIENYKAALDTCGEWFLERSGELYYIPCEEDNMSSVEIYAPITDKFLILRGSNENRIKNLRFENLRFEVAGYHTPIKGNEPAQAAAPIEAVIMLDYAKGIDFVNCKIAHTGTNAIWFRKSCTDCSVTHCYLHDLGAGGVKVGDIEIPEKQDHLTNNITIENNIIRSGGFVFPCAIGITIFQASDNKIVHNEIANFRYSGISVGWVWGYAYSPSIRNTIEYNHIHHLGWGELSDMGGIYTLGDSEGTTVRNNVIHHIYSSGYGGWGLYTDEGTRGILMENNLVYACKSAGFHQHYGRDNIIRNNIFALIQLSAIKISKVEEHLSYTFTNNIIYQENGDIISDVWDGDNGTKIKVNFDYNCYWKANEPNPEFYGLSFAKWKKSGRDKNSIIADPGFVDPQNFDFEIKNKSAIRKIHFKPFDFSKAGVYGSDKWKQLSKFDISLKEKFNDVVEKHNGKIWPN
jgi:hypothetical protein